MALACHRRRGPFNGTSGYPFTVFRFAHRYFNLLIFQVIEPKLTEFSTTKISFLRQYSTETQNLVSLFRLLKKTIKLKLDGKVKNLYFLPISYESLDRFELFVSQTICIHKHPQTYVRQKHKMDVVSKKFYIHQNRSEKLVVKNDFFCHS